MLYHSPNTRYGNWTDGPSILPHDVVLRKVITGRQVISGPLTKSTGRAGELICQIFMGFTGCTDPAAVLAWEIAEFSGLFFQKALMPGMFCSCIQTTHKKTVSYLPAFSSSHCAHRGRCTVRWVPLLWASESNHCSESDSPPIHLLAHNRNAHRSAGS